MHLFLHPTSLLNSNCSFINIICRRSIFINTIIAHITSLLPPRDFLLISFPLSFLLINSFIVQHLSKHSNITNCTFIHNIISPTLSYSSTSWFIAFVHNIPLRPVSINFNNRILSWKMDKGAWSCTLIPSFSSSNGLQSRNAWTKRPSKGGEKEEKRVSSADRRRDKVMLAQVPRRCRELGRLSIQVQQTNWKKKKTQESKPKSIPPPPPPPKAFIIIYLFFKQVESDSSYNSDGG